MILAKILNFFIILYFNNSLIYIKNTSKNYINTIK